ncbi:chitin deacetylase, partial [Phenoliferia sp. Uapishka_3]
MRSPNTLLFVAPLLAFASGASVAKRQQSRSISADPFSKSSLLISMQYFTTAYPTPDVSGPTPKAAWVTTYNAAKAKGLIPSFAPSSLVNGNPTYPTGVSTGSSGACSWTVSHCYGAADVVDAPTGIVGISFDDGPQLASPVLYQYLASQMIGSRILDNPSIFQQAITTGGQIAVHTWSHPYMTSMTDMQVLGEIGWTQQIILDQSGKVPAFWRPPYGDVDNRVRAIAKEVFGLTTVIWNQDTFDWCLTTTGSSSCVGAGPGNDAGLDKELQAFYKGPKSPGLIILEHELTSHSVGGFVRNFPTLKSQGWIPKSIPDIWGVSWFQATSQIGTGSLASVNSTSARNSSSGIPTSIPASRKNSATVTLVTPTGTDQLVTAAAVTTASSASASGSVKASSAARSSLYSSALLSASILLVTSRFF